MTNKEFEMQLALGTLPTTEKLKYFKKVLPEHVKELLPLAISATPNDSIEWLYLADIELFKVKQLFEKIFAEELKADLANFKLSVAHQAWSGSNLVVTDYIFLYDNNVKTNTIINVNMHYIIEQYTKISIPNVIAAMNIYLQHGLLVGKFTVRDIIFSGLGGVEGFETFEIEES